MTEKRFTMEQIGVGPRDPEATRDASFDTLAFDINGIFFEVSREV